MQTLNRNAEDFAQDFVDGESFFESLDFPTEEELCAALDASLEQSPWLPRPIPTAVGATSRNLAQHWGELHDQQLSHPPTDDHYLGFWMADQQGAEALPVEPDFMLDLTQFLMDRLAKRMRETRQAQHLLSAEVAKFHR